MKYLRAHRRIISTLMFALMAFWQIGQPLQAATFYWDSDANDAGNATDGTGLGGTGTWDASTANWWNLTADVAWPNLFTDTAVFGGAAGTVTLGTGINVGTLQFLTTGYEVTGDTLTLGDIARVDVAAFGNATISSIIAGSSGLTKTGNGTLVLTNNSNSYTGDTVIRTGALVISNEAQLGASTNTISVFGLANTGNPGLSGGQLIVNGIDAAVTMTREISVQGRGPGAANSVGSLTSIGNNIFNGDLNIGGAGSEGRALATHGTSTINGDVFLGSSAANIFFGNGNWIVNGVVSGSDTAGDRFVKSGNLIGSTIWLTNASNDFRQTIRVDSGTVRVSGPNALGALGNNTGGQALDSNGGFIEIHSDSTDFSSKSFRKRGNGGGIFVDHDFGSTVVAQTMTFGDMLLDANASFTLNGRNGFGATFTPADGKVTWSNGGTGALTNNSNGPLTINANIERGSETSARTFVVTGNGETVLTGNLLQLGTGAVTLDKRGRGTLTIGGSASTYSGITNLREGTISVSSMGALGTNSTLKIGGTGGTSLPATSVTAALEYTGAGEVSTKVIDLQGTTGGANILGNGTGGLTLTSNLTATGAGSKTLRLGGSFGSDTTFNTIAGAIVNNSGTNTTSVLKFGSGSWVLTGANTYTGSTAVTNGILAVADTFSGASRNVLGDTNALIFDVDAYTQSAGGIFAYAGDGANASAETIGSLAANAGSGTVAAISGTGGSAELTFGALGAIAKGATINFVTDLGSSITLTGASETNGILDARLFYNGADFAAGSLLSAAAYTFESTGAVLAGGNATPYSIDSVDIADQTTVAINAGLKFTDTRQLGLATGATLTINNGANTAGGILVTGGSTVTISGGAGITSGGSGELVFRTDGAADTLNLNTAITSTTTGGWTKAGAGTLVLGAANANTAAGAININEGTVRLGTGGTLGATNSNLNIRQGGTLDLNGNSLGTVASNTNAVLQLNGAGNIINSGAPASIRVLNSNSNSSYFTGQISGNIALVKGVGNGSFRLEGAHSYSGGVSILGGNLIVTHLADIGQPSGLGTGDATDNATNAASLVFGGGILYYRGADGTIYQTTSSPSVSINRLFTLAGNGTIYSEGGFGAANRESTANNAAIVFNNPAPVAFSGTGNRTLTLRGNSLGDNFMGLQLVDNPNTGTLAVSKFDGSLWILGNAANSYTGVTTIGGGALRAQDGTSLPTASNLLLNGGGGIFQSSGTFTRALGTAAGQVRFSSTDQRAGFAASEAPLTVNLGTSGLIWGSSNSPTAGTANFLATGTLYLSSTTSWADTTFVNDFEVTEGIGKNITITTPGSGTLTTITLTTGNTTGLSVGQSITGTNIPAGAYITSINSNTQISISANATAGGSGIAATVSGAGWREIRVDDNGNTGLDYATISGVISGVGSIGKVGAGLLVLGDDNTYTGKTVLREGFLTVSSIGAAGVTSSSLGTNVGGGALEIGNPGGSTTASLLYVGPGETTTRTINLVGTTGTRRIDASGSGPLVLTDLSNNSVGAVNTTGGAKTLELRGVNTDGNMVTSVLANNGGALSVTKGDGGTWILNPSAPNTFTGSLTAAGGALGLTSDAIGSASSLNFSNGSIFAYGGDLTTNKLVQINNNTAAVFAGSNNITLNGTFQVQSGNNDQTISNNLENGAVLTINNNFTNLKANDRTIFIRGYGSTVWNGIIQDAAANKTSWDIRIANNATFTMDGLANTYTGSTTLGQGTVLANKTNPFGTGGNFNFYGGVLQAGIDLSGGDAISNPVHLLGEPVILGGTNNIEFSGKLTNNNADRQLVNDLSGGAVLTLSGGIDLTQNSTNRTLTIRGSGDTVVNSVIANGSTATASALRMRGTGTLTLTAANTYAGATTIENGTLILSGAGTLGSATTAVVTANGIGTFRIDNSGTDNTNRVADGADLNLDHGTLDFIGNAAGSSEDFGRLDINGNGLGKIVISGGDSTLTFDSLNFANTGSSLDVSGIPNLGSNNKILFTTAPSGTAVSNGILSKVLLGSDFAEYNATNGIQAFSGYNSTNDLVAAASTDTMNITASGNIVGSRTLNALKLNDATGLTIGATGSANATLTLTSGALLALGGGSHTINVPILNLGANNAYFQVATGTTLNIDSAMTGAAFTLLQGGSVNLNAKQFYNSTTNIHAGTLKLANGSLNTIFNSKQTLFVNPGGTLDLNGSVQFMGPLNSTSGQPGGGGSIITTGGPATYITDNGGTWTGVISGAINLGRVGGSTLTIGSNQDYTGWTMLTASTTTLRDNGALSNTSAIDINLATLFLANNDNLQIQNNDRINDAAAITLRSGTISLTGRVFEDATETLGDITSLLGANTITVTFGGTGTAGAFASTVLTINSLSRSPGTTINFTGSTLGAEVRNSKILFNTPLTSVGNGVLGAWAIANTTDYAAYNTANGVGVVGGGGFVGYDAGFAPGNITNLGMGAAAAVTTTLTDALTTTGLLRFNGGFTNDLKFTAGTDVLHLELGGILRSNNNNLTSIGTPTTRGVITTGTSELVVFNNQNTLTINSVIQGTNSLVKSGAGTLTLTAPNTYSGGTYVNQGTLRLEGDVGVVTVPNGVLSLINSTVTMITNAGQIDSGNTVTLNGSSTLTMVGNNTLDSVVFNHVGGTGAPTVTSGGILTLTNSTPVTVSANSAIGVPTIAGTLELGSGSKTIHAEAIQLKGVVYENSLNSSLLITAAITGTGLSINKTGDGLVEFAGQSLFNGMTVAAGGVVIGANSTGTVATSLFTGPLGYGTVSMASGTRLGVDDSSRTVANAFVFSGDPIFTNVGTSTDTMTLNGALTFSTLATTGLVANVDTPYLNVVLGGDIQGLGSVTSIGTGSGINTITKTGPGNIIGLNLNGVSTSATIDLAGLTNLNSFSLLHDGDGTSGFETINLGTITFNPVNGGNLSLTIGRAGAGVSFPAAAYKTIALQSLNATALPNGITVTNNNGYGLDIPDDIDLAAANSWTVANVNTSLQVPGLTLSGVLSGANGIGKAGNGILKLGNTGNTFSGDITITNGTIEGSSDAVFGDTGNVIQLGSNSLTEGLRISGTFATDRTINLTAASGGIDVTGGNTFTLNNAFTFDDPTYSLAKNDLGTLVLTQAQTGWDGVFTINQGLVRISDPDSLGSTTGTTNFGNVGAALELTGGITVAEPFVMGPSDDTLSNGINGGGAIRSVSGNNVLTGPITLNAASGTNDRSRGATFTADLGATLDIQGVITGNLGNGQNRDSVLGLGGAGNGTLSTALALGGTLGTNRFFSITKFGTGRWDITAANAHPGTRLIVKQGTLALSGSGTLGAPAGGQETTPTVYLNPTGTLLFDNALTNVNNRLSGRALNVSGADVTLLGNAAGTSETVGAFTLREGLSIFTLDADAGGQLDFATGAITRSIGSTLLIRGDGFGSAAGAGVSTFTGSSYAFTGQLGDTGTANKSILPWALGDTSLSGLGIGFVTADSAGGAANTGSNILRLLSPSEQATDLTTAGANVNLTSAETLSQLATFNSLQLGNGGGVGLQYVPLTLDSGGLLTLSGNTGISGFSGVSYLTSTANTELVFHTQGDFNLMVPVAATTGTLTKSGAGTLTLTAGNTNHGTVYVNDGTLKLGGGDQTILPGRNLQLNHGGTLDLNGTVQQFNLLESRLTAALSQSDLFPPGAGGTVVNNGVSQATLVLATANVTFAGSIQGDVAVVRGQAAGAFQDWNFYAPQTYTGPTLLNGGRTQLLVQGSLTSTASVEVSNATLLFSGANGQTENVNITDRIGDTIPVTLRGAALHFNTSAAYYTTETMGAITLAGGQNVITLGEGGTRVNQWDLTAASLTNAAGSRSTLRFYGIDGDPNDNARLFLTSAPVLTNNLIGGWAVFEREFASYTDGQGIAGLNTQGYAGYSPNLINDGVTADNIRITPPAAGSLTLLTGNRTVNSLAVLGAGSATGDIDIDLGGNTLTLVSGGLIASGATDNRFINIANGNLTAGPLDVGGDLYLHTFGYVNGNTDVVNRDVNISATLTNNGSGVVTVVINGDDGRGTGLDGALGASSTNITGSNTYTGGTYVNAGRVVLSNPSANGTTITTTGFGDLFLAGGASTLGNDYREFRSSVIYGASDQIANTATVTVQGNARWNLNNFNQTIENLVFNNTGGHNPEVTTGSGTLTVTGGSITAGGQNPSSNAISTINGKLALGAATTFTVNPVMWNSEVLNPLLPNLTIGASIEGTDIVKDGAGVLRLTGSNAFTGGFDLQAGGLALGSNNALSTGVLTIGDGTFLTSTADNRIMANDYVISGDFALRDAFNLTLNGNTVLAAGLHGISVELAAKVLALGGIVSGAGGINKTGDGILQLNNSNTYSGATIVADGTLRYGAVNALPTGTAVTVLEGGMLDITLGDVSVTIGSLAGNSDTQGGVVYHGATSGTLTLTAGGDNSTTAFGGVITNAPGSTMSFVKAGTGTLTLGGSNQYNGSTVIEDGRLVAQAVSGGNALGSSQSLVFGGTTSSGILQLGDSSSALSQTFTSISSLGSGNANAIVSGNAAMSTLTLDLAATSTFAGNIGGAGLNEGNLNLVKAGSGDLVISGTGTSTYSGTTAVNGGKLFFDTVGGFSGTTTTLTVADGSEFTLRGNTSNTVTSYGFTGVGGVVSVGTSTGATLGFGIDGAVGVNQLVLSAGQTLQLTGTLTTAIYVNGAPTSGNQYVLIDGADAGSLTGFGGTFDLNPVVFNGGSFTYALALTSGVNGGGLQQWTLTPTAVPSAPDTWWTGDLTGLAQGVWSATLTTGTGSPSNWATDSTGVTDALVPPDGQSNVHFSASSAANFDTTLGANMTIKSLTFHTGNPATTIGSSNGVNTLTLGNGVDTPFLSIQTGTGDVAISAIVNLTQSQSWNIEDTVRVLTLSGGLTGTGVTLTVNDSVTNAGTLLFSGNAAAMTGTLAFNAGTLIFEGTGSLNSGLDVVLGTAGSAATLQVGGTTEATSVIIGGLSNGALAGSQVIGGNATLSTLSIGPASGSASFNGAVGGVGANDNNFNLEKTGAGTQILDGSITYAGATVIREGTLQLGASSSFAPTGAFSVIANAGATAAFDFNGKSFTTNGDINLGGGSGGMAQILDTAGTKGVLTLNIAGSNIIYDATNDPGDATISANLVGTGFNRTITVGNSANSANELSLNGTFTTVSNNNLTLSGDGNVTINGNIDIDSATTGSTNRDLNFSGTGAVTINATIKAGDDIVINSGVVNATVGGSLDSKDDVIIDGTGTQGSAIVNISSTTQVHTGDDFYIRNGGLVNVTATGGIGTGTDQLLIGDSASASAAAAAVLNLVSSNISVGTNGFLMGNGTNIGNITGTGTITTAGSKDLRNGSIDPGIILAGNGAILKQNTTTVVFSGERAAASTGATHIRDGTLILDYTVNNNSKIGGVLNLGQLSNVANATLTLNGNASADTVQSVSSTAVLAGNTTVALNNGGSQFATLNMGGFTRTLPGGVISFEYAGANTVATTTSPEGTLGWANLSIASGIERFAAIDGSGNIVQATFTTQNDVSLWAAGQNIINDAAFTGAISCATIDTLTFSAALASTVSLTSTGHLILATGGIMVDSGIGAFNSVITGGTLIGATSGVAGEVIIHQNNTAGDLVISSTINGSITKSGAGTLVLSGNNSFAGTGTQLSLLEGTLQLGGGNAIGDRTAVYTRVGTTLNLNNSNESIGHLLDESNGTIALGTGDLTFNQTNNADYRGVFTGTTASVLTLNAINDTRTTTYNFNISSTTTTAFTGTVVVNSGLLQLSSNGRLANATAFTINKNGLLLLDENGTTRSNARILDTATITLNSADGAFNGQTRPRGLAIRTDQDGTLDETVGVVTAASGASYIGMESTTANDDSDIIVTNLVRSGSATLNARGTNLGSTAAQNNQFRIGNTSNQTAFINAMIGGGGAAGSTTISIVPWAIGQSTTGALADTHMGDSLVTYVANAGLRPLATSEYATLAAAGTTANARESITADLTSVAGTTVNALVIHNASTAASALNVTGAGAGQSLTSTSGAFLFTLNASATASSAHSVNLGGFDDGIKVGGSEYIFFVVNPSSATTTPKLTATIDSVLNSTASVTKSGRGTLEFTAVNTYDGGTTVNEGAILIHDNDNLGSGAVTLAGGTLSVAADYADDLGGLAGAAVTVLSGGGTIEVLGTSVTATNLSFSGAGTVTKTGTGTLQLAGTTANTQTSDFEVKRGVVELNKTAGVNAITGANLLIGFNATLNETSTVRLLASNQIANSTNVSLRSSTTGALATLDLNDNSDTIGALSMGTTTGSGVVVKTGASGVLTVTGDITLNSDRSGNDSGTNAGNVRITGTGAANTGTLNLGGAIRTITVQTVATGTGLGNADAIIDTAITNGGVVKEGSRALVLTGQNTYTDGTIINDGELQLRNASLSTGAVTVNEVGGSLSNAAILSGTGSIDGAVTIGEANCGVGILAVGSLTATSTLVPNYGTGAKGTLTFNAAGTALTVASGSQIQMEITAATVAGDAGILDALSANTYVDAATYITNNSPAWTSGTPGNHDFINLTAGTLSLASRSGGAGTGTVAVLNSGYVAGAQKGDVFNLIDWTGVMAGTFATTGFTQGGAIGDLDLPTLSGELFWDTSAFATHGVIVVVPEPSRALLLLLGLLGLMVRRRRR